jgi:hypothetical protein
MILIDANLLLYAYDKSSERHAAAKAWLEDALSGTEPVALPWAVLTAFLRIGTNPRALKHPLTIKEAVAIVSSWLEQPCVTVLEPGQRYWSILGPLLPASQARAGLVSDAYLAALCIEHGAVLHTVDADFARFKGLKRRDPVARDDDK